MGICWYCHWGWAVPVVDIYNEALAALDDDEGLLEYGPGHNVWCDENFQTSSIENCLKPEWFDNPSYWPDSDEITADQKRIVRESLEKLLAVPEEIRCCEPDDYDDEHPENFPPLVEVVRKG